jgi:hypothetical protein
MPPLAVVLLAHADAAQVKRLIAALAETPIVLHCDARTPDSTFREMTADRPDRVRVTDRVRTTVTSWSLVHAELLALREAVRWTNAEHIAVLSGADYPLMPMDEIIRELRKLNGRSWIHNVPLPIEDWGTPRHRDGGMWRLRYRYLTRGDQVLYWRDLPLRWPWRRTVPDDLCLRGASQWKIYSRTDVVALHRLADERPDLIRFWASTLVPDETFAASMLGSRRLFGGDALEPCASNAWYLDWAHSGHPHWLSDGDFDRLKAARWADITPGDGPSGDPDCRKLFARKFRSTDPGVLDRVDEQLRC